MEHRVPLTLGQNRLQRRRVFQPCRHQPRTRQHGAAMPGAEVVEHHHLRALFQQGGDQVAADKSGAAGDKKATGHGCNLQ